jgi:hypothetical protein
MFRKFPKEDLQNLAYDKHVDNYEIIKNERSHSGYTYKLIFKFENLYYETTYEKGMTEYENLIPFEYKPNCIDYVSPTEIECFEVVPIEKTTIAYEPAWKYQKIEQNDSSNLPQ